MFAPLCNSHFLSEYKAANQCEKCHMYSTKVVENEEGTFCQVCWDEISDRDPRQWCAFRTTKKACTRSAREECEGLCQAHFDGYDKCRICGVFRNKKMIPPNIRQIDFLGGKVCRRCVNRVRRMSAMAPELPSEFERARREAEQQQEDREEKHREAEAKRRAEAAADREGGEGDEGDGEGDASGLDNKHVDHKDERPVSARTRGSKRPREEKSDSDAESDCSSESEGSESESESEFEPSDSDEEAVQAPVRHRSKRIRVDDE